MDLTLDRVRQMVSVVSERIGIERRVQVEQTLNTAEIVLKTLGSWMPALASNEKAAKRLAAAAKDFSLKFGEEDDDQAEKELPSTAQVARFFGGIGEHGLMGVK